MFSSGSSGVNRRNMYDNNFDIIDALIRDFYNNFYTAYSSTEERMKALKRINDAIAIYECAEMFPVIDNGFKGDNRLLSLNVPTATFTQNHEL